MAGKEFDLQHPSGLRIYCRLREAAPNLGPPNLGPESGAGPNLVPAT